MGIHHLRFGGLRDALIDGVPGSAGSLRCSTRAPAPRIGTFPVISTVQVSSYHRPGKGREQTGAGSWLGNTTGRMVVQVLVEGHQSVNAGSPGKVCFGERMSEKCCNVIEKTGGGRRWHGVVPGPGGRVN